MDMQLHIEPLHVVERRCIMDAMEQCNWRVRDAAIELQIGKAKLYRRLHEYTGGDLKKLRALAKQQYREDDDAKYGWSKMQKPPGGALRHRRRVEATIEQCGGCMWDAAKTLGVTREKMGWSMTKWHRENEALIRSRAGAEGVSQDEIEVMLRRRTMEEHAERNGFCIMTGYKMIDEACAIFGLRRYRHWLFLCVD